MLKHVSFVTADADAVRSFYSLLGGVVSKDLITDEGYRRLVLTFGGGKLQFFERPAGRPGAAATPPGDGQEAWELQTNLQDHPDLPAPASQLLHPDAPRPVAAPDSLAWMEHVALHLPDLDASLAQLRAMGVTFSRERTLSPGGNPMAFVLDPDGRQVELLQAEP